MSNVASSQVLIVGTGPAGLGAAAAAKEQGLTYRILEANSVPFGHCKSFTLPGYPEIVFDEGPHISFTKNETVQALFAKSAGQYNVLQPVMKNYWSGHFIDHPVQSALWQIPLPAREEICEDLKTRPNVSVSNYGDWLHNAFGDRFSKLFHERYTRKYWTLEPSALTTEWVGQRVFRPETSEMLKTVDPNYKGEIQHYFTHFRYPKAGGFQSFLKKSFNEHREHILMNEKVEDVDVDAKTVRTSSGKQFKYENLVSSAPLNLLPHLIQSTPKTIADDARKLHVTSVTLYSYIYRTVAPVPSHWLYIYDEEIPFARLYFPKSLINAEDQGLQALQVEVYSSPFRSREQSHDNPEAVLRGLEQIGLLKAEDVVAYDQRHIKYANVIFDHDREPARTRILEFLRKKDILSVGRFGEWAYLWSDESYISGYSAVINLEN